MGSDSRRCPSCPDQLPAIFGVVPAVLAAPLVVAPPIVVPVLVIGGVIVTTVAAYAIAKAVAIPMTYPLDNYSAECAAWLSAMAALAVKGNGTKDPCWWTRSPQSILMRFAQIVLDQFSLHPAIKALTPTELRHLRGISVPETVQKSLNGLDQAAPTLLTEISGFSQATLGATVILLGNFLGWAAAIFPPDVLINAMVLLAAELKACGVDGAWVAVEHRALQGWQQMMERAVSQANRRFVGRGARRVAVASGAAIGGYIVGEVADAIAAGIRWLKDRGMGDAQERVDGAFVPAPVNYPIPPDQVDIQEWKHREGSNDAFISVVPGVEVVFWSEANGRKFRQGWVEPGLWTPLVMRDGQYTYLTGPTGQKAVIELEPYGRYQASLDEDGQLFISGGAPAPAAPSATP